MSDEKWIFTADDARQAQRERNMLKELWNSSTGLLYRFGLTPNVGNAQNKLQQEWDELQVAIDTHTHAGWADDEDELVKEIRDEGVDVIVTLLNLLNAYGVTWDEVESGVKQTIDKNDRKNHNTHEVHTWADGTKTIERIGRYGA